MSTQQQHKRLDKIEHAAGTDGGTHHVVTYAEEPGADWADFTEKDELNAWKNSLPAQDTVCVVAFDSRPAPDKQQSRGL